MVELLDDSDTLAGSYVLGTADTNERALAQRRIAEDPTFAAAVSAWEQRLSPLAEAVAPVPAPLESWSQIERITGSRAEGVTLLQRINFWRWTTGLATAIAAVLAILILGQPRQIPTLIAVLDDPTGRANWVLSLDRGAQQVAARPVEARVAAQTPPDRSLQLWLIVGQGAPLSLGLIDPRAERVLALPPGVDLQDAALAVSLEPPGGSPTDAPTGPVVAQGRVLRL